MRGGDAGDEDEEAAGISGPPVSPYSQPNVPDRRSVIPPSKETFTFPSGRVARPVEEYLVPEAPSEASSETSESEGGEPGSEAEVTSWPFGEGKGSDSGDGGSRGQGTLPRWIFWAGLGAVGIAIIVGIIAFSGGFSPGPTPNASTSPTESTGPEVPSFFDDGIAEEEYPAPATWRGEGYPEALVMDDWVWNRVGSQWAVVLFAE